MEKIGLISGNRKFPILFSQSAKSLGFYIVAVAVKGEACRGLKKTVDKIYWVGLNEFSRLVGIFKQEGIKNLVMAGQIRPYRLFSKEVDKDPFIKGLLGSIKDKKADTIFRAIAEKLEQEGFKLLDSTTFMERFMPKAGILTKADPPREVMDDIHFGLHLAKQVAAIDIGQAVAVKDKAIVAVEALEGTDNLIKRAGKITPGVTIVKVNKPNQDKRFDIPVVGLNTVKNLIKAKARCLAIEAEKTLFIDQPKSVKLAEKNGILIAAV